jgi:TRAP-type C4-dicarboxylate transport system permease small subunit
MTVSMYAVLDKVSAFLARCSEYIAAVMVASMTLILILQVILRTFFNSGISWSDEFARYATIWAVMLVGNVLIRDNELITVDFFDKLWPDNMIKWRNSFYQVLFVIITLMLGVQGWHHAADGLRMTTTAMEINSFWPYLAIPVGSFLMCFQFVCEIIRNFRKEG